MGTDASSNPADPDASAGSWRPEHTQVRRVHSHAHTSEQQAECFETRRAETAEWNSRSAVTRALLGEMANVFFFDAARRRDMRVVRRVVRDDTARVDDIVANILSVEVLTGLLSFE